MGATNYATIEGYGRLVINSNCVGGNVTVRGFFPPVTDQVVGGFAGTLTDTQRYGEDQSTYAITNGWVSVTGTVNANVVSQANIDFGALQKSSLNAATPASVVGSVGSVVSPVTVTGYVNVTGTVDANVEKWNTVDVVSNAIPAFAAGGAGGIPTVDASNYIAGIAGTKNQLDDLNDIAAGAQMDLINIPNATAVTAFTDDVFAEQVEGTVTFRQWIRRAASILFGKASGGGVAGSKKFRNLADTKDRVDATTDVSGNRTGVNFDDT